MVGRFIEEKDIGFEEDSTSEGELHLPSSRKGTDGSLLTFTSETDSLEDISALLLSLENTGILDNERDDRVLGLVTIDIVLDVESSDLVGRRETFDLTVVDGSHEGRLSRSVSSTESVSVSTLETKGSGVEENLGTVGEREGTVTEIFTLLLIGESLDGLSLVGSGSLENILDDTDGRVGADRVRKGEGNVRNESRLPLGRLPVTGVAEMGSELSGVIDERGRFVEVGSRVDLSDGSDKSGSGFLRGDVARRREVGSVTGAVGGLTKGLDGLDDDTTSLWVTDSLLDLDETGKKFGDEGSDSVFVVDEFGHVVDNDSDLSDGSGELLGKTTGEEGSHESEGRRVDFLNESGSGKELDSLGGLLDGVDKRVATDGIGLSATNQKSD